MTDGCTEDASDLAAADPNPLRLPLSLTSTDRLVATTLLFLLAWTTLLTNALSQCQQKLDTNEGRPYDQSQQLHLYCDKKGVCTYIPLPKTAGALSIIRLSVLAKFKACFLALSLSSSLKL